MDENTLNELRQKELKTILMLKQVPNRAKGKLIYDLTEDNIRFCILMETSSQALKTVNLCSIKQVANRLNYQLKRS